VALGVIEMPKKITMKEKEKLLEIIAAKHSKCAWISNMAGICIDKILFRDKTIDEAYEELQKMRHAVKETPGAC